MKTYDGKVENSLYYCAKGICEACHYNSDRHDECMRHLIKDACQENLTDERIIEDQRITIQKQQAEIDKLTINMNAYGLGMIQTKERAENIVYRLVKRLKDRVVSKYEYTDTRIFKELDELVVEMEDEISDVVKGSKLTGLEKVEHNSLCETDTFEKIS